jgi:hypothetical protein
MNIPILLFLLVFILPIISFLIVWLDIPKNIPIKPLSKQFWTEKYNIKINGRKIESSILENFVIAYLSVLIFISIFLLIIN